MDTSQQGNSNPGPLRDPILAGEHCSVADCRQIDFLPFSCDCCHKVFCLEHRQYEAHACPEAKDKVLEVVPCPLCARGIRLRGGRDPNEEFELHLREGCDPDNYRKVHKKKTCPVEGCRQKLTETGSYVCQKCQLKTCLRHRHPEDHNCRGSKGQSKPASMVAQVRQKSGNLIMDGLCALGITQPTKLTAKPPPTQPTRSPKKQSPPPPQHTYITEQCPQCGAGFPNITQLVQHVQTVHEQQRGQGQQNRERLNRPRRQNQRPGNSTDQSRGSEICPICNARFTDVIQLVSHVEQQHQQSSSVQS
eukprot:TRINITY_DN5218_c0_g1_i1.p1 TRINITY_DN5218_c0_g1~~TRINITY_DN5218_c0_g1_i1.p1  ORF type:complete len:305 (+),score=6.55 TRINITY_DN5218_c0_g1_i1:182-1096(+)